MLQFILLYILLDCNNTEMICFLNKQTNKQKSLNLLNNFVEVLVEIIAVGDTKIRQISQVTETIMYE